jgi:NADPH:quinone reductase
VQFAERLRAGVLATATGRDATALVRRLGADAVFDPRAANAIERLHLLAPDGIDAVLALAGGKVLEQCLDLVPAGGRVAYPNGIEPEPDRPRGGLMVSYDAEAGPRQFAHLERAVNEARLRVPIAAKYPLAQAAKAHARLERGHIGSNRVTDFFWKITVRRVRSNRSVIHLKLGSPRPRLASPAHSQTAKCGHTAIHAVFGLFG